MPNSHDNIPSIPSKYLRVLRVCGEYVTAITAQSTRGGNLRTRRRAGVSIYRECWRTSEGVVADYLSVGIQDDGFGEAGKQCRMPAVQSQAIQDR